MPFLRKKKKSFDEEQLSKGLVKYGNEWITPAEKFKREQLAKTKVPVVIEKETIIKEEIVKVRCQYCGTEYNAKLDRCPYCGGRKGS